MFCLEIFVKIAAMKHCMFQSNRLVREHNRQKNRGSWLADNATDYFNARVKLDALPKPQSRAQEEQTKEELILSLIS